MPLHAAFTWLGRKRGNGRYAAVAVSRRSIRVLHHSLFAGLLFSFMQLGLAWIQQRNNAPLFASDCEQRPGRASDAISRRLHLVSEMEDGIHWLPLLENTVPQVDAKLQVEIENISICN